MREIVELCWPYWLTAAVMLLEAVAERIGQNRNGIERRTRK